ncbi:MarR family transcriptional regulator [Congregibacter brevis]|uniref:MarR family transcriptional regulator n=1 Tax=Congregibacter brevis TaxID=3081201 RepID=A0ABZ0I7Q6_9GAMM|nr:MarR family transcriptional regulator [Congregibacter sp. IMCC45268]
MDSTTNLLGALTRAVSDRVEAGLRANLKRSGEAASALVFLGYTPGISVEILRQVLSLSHPGTVRLIDRLVDDGLVERRKTEDGRAVALHLTRNGDKLRIELLNVRNDVLETTLNNLSEDEREIFGHLTAKVLSALPKTELDKHHICRQCSVSLCSSDCPIPGSAEILAPYIQDKERRHA